MDLGLSAVDLARFREARPVTYGLATNISSGLDALGDTFSTNDAVRVVVGSVIEAFDDLEARIYDR